jgi:hypothetical protein
LADGNLIILLEQGIHPFLKAQVDARVDIIARFNGLMVPLPYPGLGIPIKSSFSSFLEIPYAWARRFVPKAFLLTAAISQRARVRISRTSSRGNPPDWAIRAALTKRPRSISSCSSSSPSLSLTALIRTIYSVFEPGQVNCLPGKASRRR